MRGFAPRPPRLPHSSAAAKQRRLYSAPTDAREHLLAHARQGAVLAMPLNAAPFVWACAQACACAHARASPTITRVHDDNSVRLHVSMAASTRLLAASTRWGAR
eukprot:1229782-Pleurochrysis_carterae.AAC.1